MEVSFEDIILRTNIAHICSNLGYHAITQEATNILVDVYRRTFLHLARHCKEAAETNRRVEPTLVDLIQAYNFLNISPPELQEQMQNFPKLPIQFECEEPSISNKIQRNLFVDDLLEAEKGIQDPSEEKEDAIVEEEEKLITPLLKDTYEEVSKEFPSVPTNADKKIRLGGRIVLVTNPVPINTEQTEAPKPKMKKKKEVKVEKVEEKPKEEPAKRGRGKKRKKLSREFVLPEPSPERAPTKTKEKGKCGRATKKAKISITPLDPSFAEPPSFLPLLSKPDSRHATPAPAPTPTPPPPLHVSPPLPVEVPISVSLQLPATTPVPEPTPSPAPAPKAQTSGAKQTKGKKKKKSNQFAILTETVTAAEEKEWFCPSCGGPDDGDLMVQCDTCELWYHLKCSGLKKPPEDDENYECKLCKKKKEKKGQKRPPPATIKIEPSVKTSKTPDPPQPQIQQPPSPVPASARASGSEDLCPECQQPDDGTMMIQCDDPFCAKWFHGKCVGLSDEPTEDESWFCKSCIEKQQSAFKRRRTVKTNP